MTTKTGIETKLEIVLMLDSDAKPKDYDYYSASDVRAWEKDEWHYVGVMLRVRIHNWQTGNTKIYENAGLWGVEHGLVDADKERAYMFEIAGEQLGELQAEYPELNAISMGYPCAIKEEF